MMFEVLGWDLLRVSMDLEWYLGYGLKLDLGNNVWILSCSNCIEKKIEDVEIF